MSNLFLVIQREYFERVRKKSFLLTTVLMPVIMAALMLAPALIMSFGTPDNNIIGVIDESGIVKGHLTDNKLCTFIDLSVEPDSAIERGEINGYIIVPQDFTNNPVPAVKLFMNGAIPLELQSSLSAQLKDIAENHKLLNYNITDLPKILSEIETQVTINEIRLDKEDSGFSSSLSFIIGLFMSLLLYMFILMYGQMVMTSIIEEKNNRVLELVVSSIKPFQLMLGKIGGIGLVAVTQILIWGIIITVVATLVLPTFISADTAIQLAELQSGNFNINNTDIESLQALNLISDIRFIVSLFGWMTLFLIGGFLLYASMFAAVGSAVDNVQDASQLQTFIIIPIIIALIASTSVGNAPNSAFALWMSMIPFTSPMVMMSRLPIGVAGWQPWISLIILYSSFIAMVWIAGKIYRIGIFMYGKKPNIKELIRWAKYK